MQKLKPFSPSAHALDYSVRLIKSGQLLRFEFQLRGSMAVMEKLIWPAQSVEPQRKNGLWQTTVFELFVGGRGQPSYFEFNFSPSSDWNAYSFTGERQGMTPVKKIEKNPVTRIHRSVNGCDVEGVIDLSLLGLSDIEVSATSVLDFGIHKEYWAVAHFGEKPDFHLRQSFIVQL